MPTKEEYKRGEHERRERLFRGRVLYDKLRPLFDLQDQSPVPIIYREQDSNLRPHLRDKVIRGTFDIGLDDSVRLHGFGNERVLAAELFGVPSPVIEVMLFSDNDNTENQGNMTVRLKKNTEEDSPFAGTLRPGGEAKVVWGGTQYEYEAEQTLSLFAFAGKLIDASRLRPIKRTAEAGENPSLKWLQTHEAWLSRIEPAKRTRRNELELSNIQAIQEYLTSPHTPELLTATWQVAIDLWSEISGTTYTFVPCDRTQAEIDEIERNGRLLIYVPPEADKVAPSDIPKRRTRQKEQYFEEEVHLYGWLDVDASVDAPYRNGTEEQLRTIFRSQGRVSITPTPYLVASRYHEWITGEGFDTHGTQTRLILTRRSGKAFAFAKGGKEWYEYEPEYKAEKLGGRSVGMKR